MADIHWFIRDEGGASAAEYALILALIGAAIIGSLTTLGSSIQNALNAVSSNINTAS